MTRIEYSVIEVYYNESSSNDETVLSVYTEVEVALNEMYELNKNCPNNTEYIVTVDYSRGY